MAAFGALVPAALGSITQPASIALGTPAAVTSGTGYLPWGNYQAVQLPSLPAVAFFHGMEAGRYTMEGTSYLIGLLAPDVGMTVTSTAAKATRVLTFAGASAAAARPTTGETIQVGKPGQIGAGYVTFKTTLDPALSLDQVLIGADIDATITNLTAFINNTGIQGDKWYGGRFGWVAGQWATANDINVSASTAFAAGSATVTFQANTTGTVGNTYISVDSTTTGSFPGALFTGGAIGTGTVPGSGDFRYGLAHFRSVTNSMSSISLPVVSLSQGTNANVSLAAFPTLVARDGTDYYRPFRTLVGGRKYFKVLDTTSTSATDSYSDGIISGDVLGLKTDEELRAAGVYLYDQRIQRPRVAGYPVVGKCAAMWRGRLWTGGASLAADYTLGTASGTVATRTLTMSAGSRVKPNMIGRMFRPASTTDDYQILAVSGQTVTVNIDLKATLTNSNYTIRDARDPNLLQYSEPQLPDNFPPQNSLGGLQSRDNTGITGMIATTWDTLVVYTLTSVWQVSGNTGAFRLQKIADYGNYSPNSVVAVGHSIYWLGPDGACRWERDQAPESLSKSESEDAVGIQQTIDRINGDEGDMIVSNYNQSQHKVRWWVPMDGETSNRYCLRLDLQQKTFAAQTANEVTAAVTVPGLVGRAVTVTGGIYGDICQQDVGYIDGAFGFEPKQVVSSYAASTRTLVSTGTAFPTSGDALNGVPGVVINQTTAAYQRFNVASNTSANLVLTAPLATAPTSGDFIIMGCIVLDAVTTLFDWEQPELSKAVEAVTLAHEIETTATEVWCGASADNGSPEVFIPRGGTVADAATMSETDGEHHFWLYTAQGRLLQLRFLSFVRGYNVRIRGFQISIQTPELEEVEG